MLFQIQRWAKNQSDVAFFKKRGAQYYNQTKSLFLIAAVMICAHLIFIAPALYFVLQNYDIFKSIAFDQQSQLIYHLDQEVFWLKGFALFGSILLIIFNFLFISQILNSVTKPTQRLESHMRKIARGQWRIPHFRTRDEDIIKPLAMTYEDLHTSLKEMAENELALLKKLNIDPSNREAYSNWEKLLKLKISLISENSDSNIKPLKLVKTDKKAS